MGIRLSIDDFGTGYSSLAQLRRLPVAVLKIDRSFVNGLDGPATDVHMVTAIITMAHNLGLLVVAEGTETPEQVRVLQELGCDEVQGYLFSRPLPADELGPLLLAGSPSLDGVPAGPALVRPTVVRAAVLP